MDRRERIQLLERHCVQLREHFSSVQIVAVRQCDDDPDATEKFSLGKGSWYERHAAMLEQVDADRARNRRRAELEAEEDAEQEGE